MIESLHIEDLGVIEQTDLLLSPGLTALTGETGAGKTMVLTSLGLLLGQRAGTAVVRRQDIGSRLLAIHSETVYNIIFI